MKPDSVEFEELVWKFLDHEMDNTEFTQFEEILLSDPILREHYQTLVEVHQSIHLHAHRRKLPDNKIFSFKENSPAPAKAHFPWKTSITLTGVAAALCLLLYLLLPESNKDKLNVTYSSVSNVDIRGIHLSSGELATPRMIQLIRGSVSLHFPGKTDVIIKGPALYQVVDNQSIILSSGSLNVHHQGQPGEFKVITPLGDLTDMGTKFGVSVGNGITDSMVMTEVYEGEVIYSNTNQTNHSIKEGKGLAILGNNSNQTLLKEVEGSMIKVSSNLNQIDQTNGSQSHLNIALGKPVTCNSFYSREASGEVFPPSALTDSRINDSGSPWNWSFWLAEDGKPGTVTIDLLNQYNVSRVELQNTGNRHHHDRGIKDFVLELSTDNITFEEVYRGQLSKIQPELTPTFPFETLHFQPVKSRYIRVRGLSYYQGSDGKGSDGGGLNEIRVYE